MIFFWRNKRVKIEIKYPYGGIKAVSGSSGGGQGGGRGVFSSTNYLPMYRTEIGACFVLYDFVFRGSSCRMYNRWGAKFKNYAYSEYGVHFGQSSKRSKLFRPVVYSITSKIFGFVSVVWPSVTVWVLVDCADVKILRIQGVWYGCCTYMYPHTHVAQLQFRAVWRQWRSYACYGTHLRQSRQPRAVTRM